MNTGILELEVMEFRAYHGCLEREKIAGNDFVVDFRGEMDMSAAAENDRLEDAVNYYEENEPKGECVLVLEGRSREELRQEEVAKWEEMSIEEHMEYYLNQGIQKKDAMKMVAKDRGVTKRDIYQQLL